MAAGEDLSALDDWLGRVLAGLAPAQRRRAALKLGQALRRANLARIAANIEPDGNAMAPRKPRLDRRGRLRRKAGGKMFRKLRLARSWSIDARADSVEIAATGNAAIAAQHHFGEEGFVGRAPDGRRILARYTARRLLGFGPGDRDLAIDAAAELVDLPR